MNDLISRQAAIDALVKAIREDPYYDSNEAINGLGVCDVRVILNDLPSAQPERKNGEWIHKPDIYLDEQTWECSECGEPWIFIEGTPSENNANFCPNCGAQMADKEV